jgi:1-aminocyclopropane-1-carboxylate deaminase/D-cysteine desulfhydrase-like pyridoxal-dependent ACC family enzyme
MALRNTAGFWVRWNKTRKLEWLIAEALDQKCDTLVTSGGIQSNFCRIAAAAAAHSGLSAHLVLGSEAPSASTGNLILNDLLAGKSTAEWGGDILGVSVGLVAQSMASKVARLADETAHLLGGHAKTEDVRIEDDHIGSVMGFRPKGVNGPSNFSPEKKGSS